LSGASEQIDDNLADINGLMFEIVGWVIV